MRVLKLHAHSSHPYWQKDEWQIELPNGEMYEHDYDRYYRLFIAANPDLHPHKGPYSHRILVKKDGIYYQECGASSGSGKFNVGNPYKIISSSEYDSVEKVTEQPAMSKSLTNDLRVNKIENN